MAKNDVESLENIKLIGDNMSNALQILENAMNFGMKIRPKVGGFPYLAEALRSAGVISHIWYLPSCQSLYIMQAGNVVSQGTPLITGMKDIPEFNRDAIIAAIRRDQAGESTFPEFLNASWLAGIVRYEVDFEKRNVTYFGVKDESYIESYPAVELNK